MKFQKDNSKISLTKEEKEKIVEDQIRLEKKAQAEQQKREEVEREDWKLKDEYKKVTHSLAMRQMSYLPIDSQLDMLWHDMEEGHIKVDKRRANTWYQHVKSVKEHNPLPENWRDELMEIQKEVDELVANSMIEVV